MKIGILLASLVWFLAAPQLVAESPSSAQVADNDDPPSDQECLRAMPPVPSHPLLLALSIEMFRDDIVIIKDRSGPRVWECTVYFNSSVGVSLLGHWVTIIELPIIYQIRFSPLVAVAVPPGQHRR